jgi:hypothetical protein
MGDRANVHVAGTYLYSHWGGTELPETVRKALFRGESRWQDEAYLARIIFCDMVAGSETELTGYGISADVGDGSDRILVVDTDKQAVGYASWSEGARTEPAQWTPFAEFVKQPASWPDA